MKDNIKVNFLLKEKITLSLKHIVGLNRLSPLQPGVEDFLPELWAVFMPVFS